MVDCVFCKIVAKQLPSKTVYEDENFLAFLDIRPLNEGHTLVIPKQHVQWTWEVSKFGDYFEVAKIVALAAMKSLGSRWVNFVTAGLGVPHAHIHVIPRFENDGHPEVPDQRLVKEISNERMDEIAKRIRAAIPEFLAKKDGQQNENTNEEERRLSEEEVEWLKREAGLE